MTDAFVCDRRGDYGECPPATKVVTKGQDLPGGNASAKATTTTQTTTQRNPLGAGSSVGPGRTTHYVEYKNGDLCEECAEAFREFWNAGGSE